MRKEIKMDVKTNVENYDSAFERSEIIVKKYIVEENSEPTDLWYEAIKNILTIFIYENIYAYNDLGDIRDNGMSSISMIVDSIPKETYHQCIQKKESALLSFTILRKAGQIQFNTLRLLQDYIDSIIEGDF